MEGHFGEKEQNSRSILREHPYITGAAALAGVGLGFVLVTRYKKEARHYNAPGLFVPSSSFEYVQGELPRGWVRFTDENSTAIIAPEGAIRTDVINGLHDEITREFEHCPYNGRLNIRESRLKNLADIAVRLQHAVGDEHHEVDGVLERIHMARTYPWLSHRIVEENDEIE